MSGSAYSPPTENLVDFNSSVFKTANEGTLTLSQAKGLFLGRTGTPNSVATTTSFTGGDIYVQGARVGLGGGNISSNVCFGNGALNSTITTGIKNIAIGKNALHLLTTGTLNTFVGANDLTASFNITTGSSNTSVGYNNGNESAYSGSDYNVYLGTNNKGSGSNILIGNNNSASASTIVIGNNSGTNGGSSVIIGNNIVISQTKAISIGDASSAAGLNSVCLGASTSATTNSTAIGSGAIASIANSIVLGRTTETVYCPGTQTTGSIQTGNDIYIEGTETTGIRAGMGSNPTNPTPASSKQTAFGVEALNSANTTAGASAFGYNALRANTTGTSNSAFGSSALALITTSGNCSAFGANSLSGSIAAGSAGGNSAFGANSGVSHRTGNANTYIGADTTVPFNKISSGASNTFVGSNITCNGTGTTDSTCLGAACTITGNNATAIGKGASAAASQVVLGTASESVVCPGTTSNNSITLSAGLTLQTAYSVSPSVNQLGYQVSNISSPFVIASFTTATPTNISSAGISLDTGVWCIEYTIELSVAGGIATCQAQTLFTSLDIAGAYSTRLFTCGATRIHTTNTYNIGDTPAFSGSFSYFVTPADILYPKFQINFTGAGAVVSGTGYYTATRIG